MQDYAKCMVYYILLFVDNNKKKQKKTTTTKQLQTQNVQVNYYKLDLCMHFNTFAMISLLRRLQLVL